MSKRSNSEVLKGLFPCHPARHLTGKVVQDIGSGQVKKDVRTRKSGPSLGHYAGHLSAESDGEANVLGVIPTFPKTAGDKRYWFVSVLALDYDTVAAQDMWPLLFALEESGVYAYYDTGTTGRGIHLYIFLSEPLVQQEAHGVLACVADLSEELGLPYPEFFPSSPRAAGKGILLPYRGAAEDGIGVNPLIDPTTGEMVPLPEAEDAIHRTELEDLRAFVETLDHPRSKAETSHNAVIIDTYSDASEAFSAEGQRIARSWTESRRQYLALGFTAFAIRIGVAADAIREAITAMEEKSSNPEVDKRLAAVNSTIEKYEKGQRIACHKFYRLAGLEPPALRRAVSWEAQVRLRAFKAKLDSAAFKGIRGYTDQDVVKTLVQIARKYGKVHRRGVEVSIAVRQLASEARVSKQTVIASLKRLSEEGWIWRSSRGKGTNSGTLVLLVGDTDLDSSEAEVGDDPDGETLFHIPRFRWGAGKLGKSVGPILRWVQLLQPCTRADVARAMGRQSRDIKAPMDRLKEHSLVDYDEKTCMYSLPANFEDLLIKALSADGTLETDLKHKSRYEWEQARFKEYLTSKKKRLLQVLEGGKSLTTHTRKTG